ncbi:hypothetical protein ACHAWX_001479 [Stephanocyclus meneghinianus]
MLIPDIHLQLWKKSNAVNTILKTVTKKTLLLKTHVGLYDFNAKNMVILTASMDQAKVAKTRHRLLVEGYLWAFVQDMESLREHGVVGWIVILRLATDE